MNSEPLDPAAIMAEHERHRLDCDDDGWIQDYPDYQRCLPYRLAAALAEIRAALGGAEEPPRPVGIAEGTFPPPTRILTSQEVEEIRTAVTDPDYLQRLAEDHRAEGVEVDNPMRREVRNRRGTDEARSVPAERGDGS